MISIRERGIPFHFNEAKRYSADSSELMELPGLGTLLMTSAVDRVEYLVHGREGKETRLHARLPVGASVPPQQKRNGARRTLDHVTVREPTNDELAAVSQLTCRCATATAKSPFCTTIRFCGTRSTADCSGH